MASNRRPGLDELERVQVRSVGELRRWLEANHGRTQGVWLVTWRKGADRPYVPWPDVVDELLCFGWVDSLPRKLDEARTMLLITPRRAGSAWSAVNKQKVGRLRTEGRMTPAGEACVEAAVHDGSWTRLDVVETLVLPDDLVAALSSSPPALDNFERFPASSRRGILEWIQAARRPGTRERRIAETAEKAARNVKANHPRGRDAGPRAPDDSGRRAEPSTG